MTQQDTINANGVVVFVYYNADGTRTVEFVAGSIARFLLSSDGTWAFVTRDTANSNFGTVGCGTLPDCVKVTKEDL